VRRRIMTTLTTCGVLEGAGVKEVTVPSQRILGTDAPCIVKMQRMLRGKTGLLSLAQGIVHWSPPPEALKAATDSAALPEMSQYGADDGDPALREALVEKLAEVNGLKQQAVMVTAGANQGFTNLVIALCDAGDTAVLFAPYYFNHMMAVQMSSVNPLVGPCHPDTMLPDVGWLRSQLETRRNLRMVVVCNPNNPSGAVAPLSMLEELSELCRSHQCWLVVDNTYEDFVYPSEVGPQQDVQRAAAGHACVGGPHVVNIFSFSKAYGMMGWRIGYLAFHEGDSLSDALLKVQDTVPICPSRLGQVVALAALKSAGPAWVADRISETVLVNRAAVSSGIVGALGQGSILGQPRGAIYFMVKLPAKGGAEVDDVAVVEQLASEHGVVVIPGSACGAPGCVRVAFANLAPDVCQVAADRLQRGLSDLFPGDG